MKVAICPLTSVFCYQDAGWSEIGVWSLRRMSSVTRFLPAIPFALWDRQKIVEFTLTAAHQLKLSDCRSPQQFDPPKAILNAISHRGHLQNRYFTRR